MNGKTPGKIRASQLITTFGPGSIVDMPYDSVMIAGTDYWPDDGEIIREPRLETAMNVPQLRSPRVKGECDVPCLSFPRYRVCMYCHRLANDFPPPQNGRASRCFCGGETHPARLILVCENGHIDDFPWVQWAHQGRQTCGRPELYLEGTWTTGSLKGLIVRCKTCGAQHDLGGALGTSHVFQRCKGTRPWLGAGHADRDCDRKPHGVLKGATNVYFPIVASAVSIPPWNDPLIQRMESRRREIEEFLKRDVPLDVVFQVMFGDEPLEEVKKAYEVYRKTPRSDDLKKDEWRVLAACGDEDDRVFTARPGKVAPEYEKWIERILLISRLREVRVLRGFTRLEPPWEGSTAMMAPLSARSKPAWLPAIETRGEGIFIVLREDKLLEWEQNPNVRRRYRSVMNNYNRWLAERYGDDYEPADYGPRFILLHTLAHLVIRQLSLECGYSSSSLRERIYCDEEMRGILIYTATPDSDGSLGGLVMQGESHRFGRLMHGVLESVATCSSDPLCSGYDPGETGSFNAAACHACTFVPETSCEYSNRLLDRAMVADLTLVSGYGFFDGERYK